MLSLIEISNIYYQEDDFSTQGLSVSQVSMTQQTPSFSQSRIQKTHVTPMILESHMVRLYGIIFLFLQHIPWITYFFSLILTIYYIIIQANDSHHNVVVTPVRYHCIKFQFFKNISTHINTYFTIIFEMDTVYWND